MADEREDKFDGMSKAETGTTPQRAIVHQKEAKSTKN